MSKFIKKNKKIMLLALISFIILIVWSLTISFIPTLLILIFAGLIYYFVTKPKGKKKKKNPQETLKTVLIFGFCFVIFSLVLVGAFGIYIITTAPKFSEEKLYNKDASILYLANCEEFAKVGDEMRQKISYDEVKSGDLKNWREDYGIPDRMNITLDVAEVNNNKKRVLLTISYQFSGKTESIVLEEFKAKEY